MTSRYSIENTVVGFGTDFKFTSDGSRLVTGAIGTNEVFVYDLGESEATQVGSTAAGDSGQFGISVAISADGQTFAAGAHHGGEDNHGYVKVFRWDESDGDWGQLGPTLEGAMAQSNFGRNVALHPDGNILLVTQENSGGLYRYELVE